MYYGIGEENGRREGVGANFHRRKFGSSLLQPQGYRSAPLFEPEMYGCAKKKKFSKMKIGCTLPYKPWRSDFRVSDLLRQGLFNRSKK